MVKQLKPSGETVWNTYLRVENYHGQPYGSLVQLASIFEGKLRWLPVSKSVDLSVKGRTVRFRYNSSRVSLGGRAQDLPAPTVKNEDGMWVPLAFFGGKSFYQFSGVRLDWPIERNEPAPPKKAEVSSNASAAASVTPVTPDPLHAKAIRRIVIDPGHGGKDPGTVGPHGVQEKDMNLLIAQELAEELRNRHGYEVLLTRMDDTFIPLSERAGLANKYNADLFISLHCNASLSPKLKGFEVYFLSEHASDSHADATAQLENSPLALEGKSAPTPGQLAAVLRSLVKNANINDASALGALIDQQVAKHVDEPRLGVKQAAFYVLRGAEMPAVLIETGFLTNPQEERLLQTKKFRARLLEGILAGIQTYDERKQKERT